MGFLTKGVKTSPFLFARVQFVSFSCPGSGQGGKRSNTEAFVSLFESEDTPISAPF